MAKGEGVEITIEPWVEAGLRRWFPRVLLSGLFALAPIPARAGVLMVNDPIDSTSPPLGTRRPIGKACDAGSVEAGRRP